MTSLRESISTISNIDDEDWALLDKVSTIIKFKKGSLIYKGGDVIDKLLFINSGIIRSYLIDSNGKDFTWHIHFSGKGSDFKNHFVTDYASFTKKKPSQLFFEVIKDAELTSIDHSAINGLYNSSERWQKIGRLIAENAYYFTHQRTLSLLTETAEVRYKRLLKESPTLLEQVPQYYIASFLGITPQSLSRIRKKISLE